MRRSIRGWYSGIRKPAMAPMVVAAIVAATAIGMAAAPPALKSAWRDRDLKIDGLNDEWQDHTTYMQDGQLSIGVQNDGEFLYAVISSSEPRRRLQLLGGLTLWIDPGGKKKETFGIVVPGVGQADIGMAGGMRPRGQGRGEGAGEGREGEGGEQRDQAALLERLNEPVTWFELVGPGKDDLRRLELKAVSDIEISRGVRQGMVTYELKIPLVHSDAHEYGIGTAAGRIVGIGLTTPKREAGQRGGRGGAGSGGRGGGIGGGGGRIGGRGGIGGGMGGRGGFGGGSARGGERLQPLDPLKLWTTATLAERNK